MSKPTSDELRPTPCPECGRNCDENPIRCDHPKCKAFHYECCYGDFKNCEECKARCCGEEHYRQYLDFVLCLKCHAADQTKLSNIANQVTDLIDKALRFMHYTESDNSQWHGYVSADEVIKKLQSRIDDGSITQI